MVRWFWLLLCGLLATPLLAAGVEIIDLPETPDTRYDLSWELLAGSGAPSLTLEVERGGNGGYQLRLEKGTATWKQTGVSAPMPALSAPAAVAPNSRVLVTLKRRPDKVALLFDHRLVLCAPAPVLGGAKTTFGAVSNAQVANARYRNVDRQAFGDDFMRPLDAIAANNAAGWNEDSTWRVAYYTRDWPGEAKDPKLAGVRNPWLLTIFNTLKTSTNGFWLMYHGVGPSWVITDPKKVYPTWDSYYVQTSVRPEYDSTVGLIAGYQDNKNYLIFRWKGRDYTTTGATRPHAELVAMINGTPRVLGTATRGFDPTQWYTLRLNLDWQHVQVLIDGDVLIDAANPGMVEGRVGLYADTVKNPRRPPVDEVTANMYTTKDDKGNVTNDAADAMRTSSIVYFDDVRIGDLTAVPDLLLGGQYVTGGTGLWKRDGGLLTCTTPGRMIAGPASWEYDPTVGKTGVPHNRFTATTEVRIPTGGTAGLLLGLNKAGDGYAWTLTPGGQRLSTVQGGKVSATALDSSDIGLTPGEWARLSAVVEGPYLALYFNNQRVLEAYDAARAGSRCGIFANKKGAAFRPLSVSVPPEPDYRVRWHESFEMDRWLITWASAEADWYPAFTPPAAVTPGGPPNGGLPHATIGPAAPYPTETPGFYWHKGGHYGNVRITVPVSAATLNGQVLHLASNYDKVGGYQVKFIAAGDGGDALLTRAGQSLGQYHFKLSPSMRLVLSRQGGYLVLLAQQLDPTTSGNDLVVEREAVVFAYRDKKPLKAEMVGFEVTSPKLGAAKVVVESPRIQDTFESAPTHWLSESGVWAVMNRYSCQPQWNWYGGFGPNTPTVWNKNRLEGDQIFEAYMGVKMQFDNAPEEYARRYRDLNVTICADGSHLNSGYSVIRASKVGSANRTVTLLMRKDVVVASSTELAHLLPPQGQGHRQWFCTRIEKRGGEIKVFLDNKLAMTYNDPQPLPGGYAGIWTLNNGVMIGRVNVSAERMTLGMPRAAAPLALQEALAPQPTPKLVVNDIPVAIATFEAGLDGWKERPGFSGKLVRERTTDPVRGANTYLKVINAYPAGDCSVNVISQPIDLRATPLFDFDYCLDPGTLVNLYVRKDDFWYEFLFTGKEAQEDKVYTVPGRLAGAADGRWHHLSVNLGALLAAAVEKKTGVAPATLQATAILFADWSSSADARYFGFGGNSGGTVLRFDNAAFLPPAAPTMTVKWSAGDTPMTAWRVGNDLLPAGLATKETAETTVTLTLTKDARFLHLQGKTAAGWSPVLHLPLPALK
jgi:hypothetical protein